MSENLVVIAIFPIYSQFGAIRKSKSGRIVNLIFSLIVTFYNTKTENRTKKSLTLLLWVKVLFRPKNANFMKKNADISKTKRALALKTIFITPKKSTKIRVNCLLKVFKINYVRNRATLKGLIFQMHLVP